jgi:quercetin dioxygenase-like cupin family protein
MHVRRVVTGHDPAGRAVVTIDDVLQGEERRPRTSAAVIWTTEGFPVDNTGEDDEAQRPVGTTRPNGTVFRVLQLSPGNAQRVHRTDSIDYAVVMSGEIDMELEQGEFVHLQAGDVVVQRGTLHNWVNSGTEPCTIAFVLIDAQPVSVQGRTLHATG